MEYLKKIRLVLLFLWPVLLLSCGDDTAESDLTKAYKLRLNPEPNAYYHYDITATDSIYKTVDDKETNSAMNTDVGMDLRVAKDSAGNLLLTIHYDKIKLQLKDGNTIISDLDAAKAADSRDPIEKMLGRLEAATITATVSAEGIVRSVNGYQGVVNEDLAAMIRKNLGALFISFPDSAVHKNSEWKLFQTETNQLSFTINGDYQLQTVQDGVTLIGSEGEVTTDSAQAGAMGYALYPDIGNRENGTYGFDANTGMLMGANSGIEVHLTRQVGGKEVQMKIETETYARGKKTDPPK